LAKQVCSTIWLPFPMSRRNFPVTRLFSWNAEPKPGSLLPALPGNSSSNCWAAAPL
jgi:hypothetical protein